MRIALLLVSCLALVSGLPIRKPPSSGPLPISPTEIPKVAVVSTQAPPTSLSHSTPFSKPLHPRSPFFGFHFRYYIPGPIRYPVIRYSPARGYYKKRHIRRSEGSSHIDRKASGGKMYFVHKTRVENILRAIKIGVMHVNAPGSVAAATAAETKMGGPSTMAGTTITTSGRSSELSSVPTTVAILKRGGSKITSSGELGGKTKSLSSSSSTLPLLASSKSIDMVSTPVPTPPPAIPTTPPPAIPTITDTSSTREPTTIIASTSAIDLNMGVMVGIQPLNDANHPPDPLAPTSSLTVTVIVPNPTRNAGTIETQTPPPDPTSKDCNCPSQSPYFDPERPPDSPPVNEDVPHRGPYSRSRSIYRRQLRTFISSLLDKSLYSPVPHRLQRGALGTEMGISADAGDCRCPDRRRLNSPYYKKRTISYEHHPDSKSLRKRAKRWVG